MKPSGAKDKTEIWTCRLHGVNECALVSPARNGGLQLVGTHNYDEGLTTNNKRSAHARVNAKPTTAYFIAD
jgi:hypothetical protein